MIHNVDKSLTDRSSPSPNTHDKLQDQPRMAHGTNSVNYGGNVPSSINSGGNSGSAAGAGAPVLFGFPKMVGTGEARVICPGIAAIDTCIIAHNLGYTPMVIGSLNNSSVTIATGQIPGVNAPFFGMQVVATNVITAGTGYIEITSYMTIFADNTNVYINLFNTTGNDISLDVVYYLYQLSN